MIKAITKGLQGLFSDRGFVICFCLSVLVLVFFFTQPLFHANGVFFGNSGDGLMTYYNSLFHVWYDKSYLYQEAMNYPYQESVFFTACHPMVTNVVKAFGLDNYTVGIINLTMLFSLPIGAWFLYFIFREFNVQSTFAAVASVGIAYLSPQVARLNSHYTLAYCFAIPAIIYLSLRFFRSPGIKWSVLIGILVFLMASTHMYFFVFYILVLAFMWLAYVFVNGIRPSWFFFLKHILIQIVIPFALLQVMIFMLNEYTDRTKNPAGFLSYLSNLSGVFYPFNRAYESVFSMVGIKSSEVAWEGTAYVGIGATILCLVLSLQFLFRLVTFKIKRLFSFTSFPCLNAMILCAIISLLYSFGWPFIFGHEDWADKIGFLKQIRSLGRFAWIFYYIMNIALVVVISEMPERLNVYKLKTVIASAAVLLLCYDAFMNIANCNKQLDNKIPELTDRANLLDENRWVQKINANEFQAILAFPWFHVGSENFYFPAEHEMDLNSYIVSLKTGLPVIPVIGARVSLHQTFSNIALVREPDGRVPEIISRFANKKDLLLLLPKDSLKSSYEKRLCSKARLITTSQEFDVERLPYDSLVGYYKQYARQKIKNLKDQPAYQRGDYFSTDSTHNYIANNFGARGSGFPGQSTISGIPKNYFCIFNDSLRRLTGDSLFTISFWMNNIEEDQQVHQVIAIESVDNGKVYTPLYSSTEGHLKQLNGKWGLIECIFKLRKSTNPVRVVLWNPKFSETRADEIDEVLFKPARTNVYRIFPKFMLINNCVYYYD